MDGIVAAVYKDIPALAKSYADSDKGINVTETILKEINRAVFLALDEDIRIQDLQNSQELLQRAQELFDDDETVVSQPNWPFLDQFTQSRCYAAKCEFEIGSGLCKAFSCKKHFVCMEHRDDPCIASGCIDKGTDKPGHVNSAGDESASKGDDDDKTPRNKGGEGGKPDELLEDANLADQLGNLSISDTEKDEGKESQINKGSTGKEDKDSKDSNSELKSESGNGDDDEKGSESGDSEPGENTQEEHDQSNKLKDTGSSTDKLSTVKQERTIHVVDASSVPVEDLDINDRDLKQIELCKLNTKDGRSLWITMDAYADIKKKLAKHLEAQDNESEPDLLNNEGINQQNATVGS